MAAYNQRPTNSGRNGLGSDYPIVATNYAATRSAMAKKLGLGRKLKKQLSPLKENGVKIPPGPSFPAC
ncbi:MucR family transcriptional regulator [Mesorhizobium sp. M2D.F.Ca.ET.223.01.1.1]|uniref:MucR family transcriptional regulator n=1 Tax=Mesorhizobium sp. M2D.F.Ca.ET.223.01.1.1 TaxID=2563940 RepID=UPI001FDF5422|nr:MucR family transcriptional regulator [Mesorhizobium sp. M2D.F.Ca.ET.223.01.1.1]